MKTIDYISDRQFRSMLLEVKEAVCALFGDKLQQLILYGSYARGEHDPESDVDIMIVANESDDELRKYRDEIVDIMTDLSLKHDVLVSLTKTSSERFREYLDVLPFFQSVYKEGVEIYGKKAA